jgi:serine/threonine protein kinase/tetratricopeptide (TPR) repeat protein
MPDSFPPAPGKSEGSFPQGHELPDSATTQSSDTLLFRRYRVIRELGRGGMGVVLLAHDTALDIPVAVKLVPDLVVKDTEAVADLRKEVLRGMALNHDGVVRTHHFEKDERGAGIVMEFVEGDNLTELKQRQPGGCFDPEQILPWLEQLCAVLDYAHREKRIIHRDLKPRNIMVTHGGTRAPSALADPGRIKVADFGIAAVISDSMSRHSMEGKVSGTLSYMSPQQAEGKRPSHLDDIHALGATIYELLTGRPPFFRGNQATIFQQIINVVPPSMAERREELDVQGKPSLPLPWEETIAACLAKDPTARPQNAGEVLTRLRRVTATQLDHAWTPPPRPTNTWRATTPPPREQVRPAAAAATTSSSRQPPTPTPSRSHVPLVLAAIISIAVLGTGLWWVSIEQPRREREARAIRVAAEKAAAEKAEAETEAQRVADADDAAEKKRLAEQAKVEAERLRRTKIDAALKTASAALTDASFSLARTSYRDILELDPNNAAAKAGLLDVDKAEQAQQAKMDAEKKQLAEQMKQQQTERANREAAGHLATGRVLLKADKYDEAEAEARKALASAPEDAKAKSFLTEVHSARFFTPLGVWTGRATTYLTIKVKGRDYRCTKIRTGTLTLEAGSKKITADWGVASLHYEGGTPPGVDTHQTAPASHVGPLQAIVDDYTAEWTSPEGGAWCSSRLVRRMAVADTAEYAEEASGKTDEGNPFTAVTTGTFQRSR